jgi:hypothetical protein
VLIKSALNGCLSRPIVCASTTDVAWRLLQSKLVSGYHPYWARLGTVCWGETRRDFSTDPGRTYFFLVKSSARHDAVTGMSMVGGLAGAVVASAATAGSDNLGPAEFVPLDEPTARTMLAELQLAE